MGGERGKRVAERQGREMKEERNGEEMREDENGD